MSAQVHVGEYEDEPVRGLPESLPEDEPILWQGAPSWRGLALRAFHARKVAIYFGALVAWRAASAIADGEGARQAAGSIAALTLLGMAAVGILAGIAWLQARATVYTITTRRVVIRFGVALTLSLNLPYRAMQAAAWKEYADGTGDLPLAVAGAEQIGYAMLWPHVRPWRFGKAVEPMLRAIPDARVVAGILGRAIAASADRSPRAIDTAERPPTRPHAVAAAVS